MRVEEHIRFAIYILHPSSRNPLTALGAGLGLKTLKEKPVYGTTWQNPLAASPGVFRLLLHLELVQSSNMEKFVRVWLAEIPLSRASCSHFVRIEASTPSEQLALEMSDASKADGSVQAS